MILNLMVQHPLYFECTLTDGVAPPRHFAASVPRENGGKSIIFCVILRKKFHIDRDFQSFTHKNIIFR